MNFFTIIKSDLSNIMVNYSWSTFPLQWCLLKHLHFRDSRDYNLTKRSISPLMKVSYADFQSYLFHQLPVNVDLVLWVLSSHLPGIGCSWRILMAYYLFLLMVCHWIAASKTVCHDLVKIWKTIRHAAAADKPVGKAETKIVVKHSFLYSSNLHNVCMGEIN